MKSKRNEMTIFYGIAFVVSLFCAFIITKFIVRNDISKFFAFVFVVVVCALIITWFIIYPAFAQFARD